MNYSKQYLHCVLNALLLFVSCLIFSAKSWAVACDVIFSNGIQATSPTGNISLNYHSVITGGSATLATKTLTDNTSWVACSGSSCAASGTAATTSSVTFLTGTGANGAISVTSANSPLSRTAGDYSTVNVAQQTTLRFTSSAGVYRTTAFTTNFQSIVEFQSGDYWINGNLTLGQETILRRIATSGTTRIFVNGNITFNYKILTQNFTSSQLLIYATGSIMADNETNLSAFIYAGGNASFDYRAVVNGAVSAANFIGADNEVTVNYQPSAFATANFAPLCSGTTVVPVLLGSWNMDEGSWNGTAAEVKDSSGNNNHGRASIAVTGNTRPSTTSGSSAYTAGLQSTCRYGAFDGTGTPARTYDYVELSGFPTLPNGFTFAAWIRSTDASAQHQRILVRDDAQNGWGLSLADGTGQPKLRFFARNITNNGAVTGQGSNPSCGVFCIDTNSVLTSNAWYYVASVIDTTAKTITLYVYNASGVLQAKTSGAYSGTWTDGTGTAAIGGETSASSEGQQSSWHFLGNIDEVNIYSGALTQANIESLRTTVRTCPAPDHYELEVPASSVTCLGTDIVVRACADSAVPCNQDNSVNTNVTLGTNAGSLNATILTLSGGSATTKLKYGTATDGSVATVTLSGEGTAATNSRKCCSGSASCLVANNCATTFKTAGFIFSNNATTSGNIATQTAGVASPTGTTYLRAVQTSTTTGACVARFTTLQSVPLAYQCVNPTACINGETLSVNGTAIPGYAGAVTPATYVSASLAFDAQGSAPIAINYSDVGAIRLRANLALSSANQPDYTLTGTSNDFVVKPYDLYITSVQSLAGINNPATTQSGNGFLPADTPFRVRVQAVSYYTGSATPRVTPNFGIESPAASLENVGLQISSLVNPASGGSLGTLANPNAFTKSGTLFTNSTVKWSEVGTVALKAHIADGSYLAVGDVTSITAVNVGRFYPNHFRVQSGTATNGCGSFTYLDQPNLGLSYVLYAENVNNNLVSNYGSTYGNNLAAPIYTLENLDNGAELNINTAGVYRFTLASNPTWAAGVMSFSANTGKLARLKNAANKVVPDGSFESAILGLKLVDGLDNRAIRSADLNTNSTSVGDCLTATNCTAKSLGALKFRFGRLRLDDAFGPETFPLRVNFATDYWTGNHFSLNTSDSCTLVPRSAITYLPKGNLMTPDNFTVNLTGGTTQGTYTTITSTHIGFNAGTAGQMFTAPTNAAQGGFVVSVDLTNLPWLRFDWNQDNDHSDDKLPNANFSFGSYRGNDRIIYWRERLQ